MAYFKIMNSFVCVLFMEVKLMQRIITLLLCALLLLNSPVQAESVLTFDYIHVKPNYTQEYQTFFLAGLCTNAIDSLDTYESIMHCRAICSQITIPTKEMISYWISKSEKYIYLTARIDFTDDIYLEFISDYIELDTLSPHWIADNKMTEASEDCLVFETKKGTYAILTSDYIDCFKQVRIAEATLVFRSPYDYEEMHDAYIKRIFHPSALIDGDTYYIPMTDDLDLEEYLKLYPGLTLFE